jgi:hypothetical protein
MASRMTLFIPSYGYHDGETLPLSRGKTWRVVALFTVLAPVFAVADWFGQCVLLMHHGRGRSIWYESAQKSSSWGIS